MRFIRIIIIGSIALSGFSCGESKPPASAELQTPQPQTASHSSANSAAPKVQGDLSTPAPPRDAQFTILCAVMNGPGHVEQAKKLKDQLIATTHQNGWYVRHEEQQSTLYYGYYRAMDPQVDAKDAARLQADRQKIATMKDVYGNLPFQTALPVAMEAADPTAPPEFNLLNAKGYWSLQIAAYEGAGRKQAAVDSVLEARKLGIEAYYHHGPNVSAVCIGAWPEAAVHKHEFDDPTAPPSGDRDQPLLVIGAGSDLPENVKNDYKRNLIDKDSGKKVDVLEEKVEVVDPTLRAAMEKFPNHMLNGYEDATQSRDPATGKIVTVPSRSLLVMIPRPSTILDQDTNAPAPGPALINPTAPAQQEGGRLRSFGQ